MLQNKQQPARQGAVVYFEVCLKTFDPMIKI